MAAIERELDEVGAELEELRAGRHVDVVAACQSVPGGAVMLCGDRRDLTCWSASFVRSDHAVIPLAVGDQAQVARAYDRLLTARASFWDLVQAAVPKIHIGGRAYHFAPAFGRRIVGAWIIDRRAVVLAMVGEQLAVLHFAGRRRRVLHYGGPDSLRELDVDGLLRIQRARTINDLVVPDAPRCIPPEIRAEHQRIMYGRKVEVGDGPSIAQVLEVCFRYLAARARALRSARTKKRRGKCWACLVADHLCKLALLGVGNIVGRVGEIIAVIRTHFPGFDITPEAMSDALSLLAAARTCVVVRRQPRERIWQINLAGLCDPTSRPHARLCRETKGEHQVAASSVSAAARPPMPSTTTGTASADSPPAATGSAGGIPPISATVGGGSTPASQEESNAASDHQRVNAMPGTSPTLRTVPADTHVQPDHADAAPTVEVGALPLVNPDYKTMFVEAMHAVIELGPAAVQELVSSASNGLLVVGDDGQQVEGSTEHGGGVKPVPPADLHPSAESPARRRRRLHLSPDHTLELPIVASVRPGFGNIDQRAGVLQEERARDHILGRTRSVGDGLGTLGARGPPD